MNLNKAYNFSNKLSSLMGEALAILGQPANVSTVKNKLLRSKVDPDASDEEVLQAPESEWASDITGLVRFTVYLLSQKEILMAAIRAAKLTAALDVDGETQLNGARQRISATLASMNAIRSSERLIPMGGTGYRFNGEGNQVSYRCDMKKVTTINFDRNAVRRIMESLNDKADETSTALDEAMVSISVDYTPPFDVKVSFADAFDDWKASAGQNA